jgi:hypothetical protein
MRIVELKALSTFLLFTFLALSAACARPKPLDDPAKYDRVVLEVVTHARGPVYPKEGDILDMRLYESGRFEYDDYPETPSPTLNAIQVTRKEARLSESETRELIDLAGQPDFLAAKNSYPAFRQHIDDEWTTIVHFTHRGHDKRITVVNYDDIRHYPSVRSNYPVSLVSLIERARDMKAKAAGKG